MAGQHAPAMSCGAAFHSPITHIERTFGTALWQSEGVGPTLKRGLSVGAWASAQGVAQTWHGPVASVLRLALLCAARRPAETGSHGVDAGDAGDGAP